MMAKGLQILLENVNLQMQEIQQIANKITKNKTNTEYVMSNILVSKIKSQY